MCSLALLPVWTVLSVPALGQTRAMTLSALDLFTVGIGPSSSHTVGPMRAARTFADDLDDCGLLPRVHRVQVELYGSLGATGVGHGTDRGLLMGLVGAAPETVDPAWMVARAEQVRREGTLRLASSRDIGFNAVQDIVLRPHQVLPGHPNGMRFTAYGEGGQSLMTKVLYSVSTYPHHRRCTSTPARRCSVCAPARGSALRSW